MKFHEDAEVTKIATTPGWTWHSIDPPVHVRAGDVVEVVERDGKPALDPVPEYVR